MAIAVLGYGFSLVALGIFAYVFFTPVSPELKADAIYWFLIALGAGLAPNVRQLRFKDLELTFDEKIEKVRDEIDQRVDHLQEFVAAAASVTEAEAKLTPQARAARDRVYRDYSERVERLPPDRALEHRAHRTRSHLARFGIGVPEVKQALARCGYWEGTCDDGIDTAFTDAIARFQARHGLEADGIFGSLTYEKLADYLTNDRANTHD